MKSIIKIFSIAMFTILIVSCTVHKSRAQVPFTVLQMTPDTANTYLSVGAKSIVGAQTKYWYLPSPISGTNGAAGTGITISNWKDIIFQVVDSAYTQSGASPCHVQLQGSLNAVNWLNTSAIDTVWLSTSTVTSKIIIPSTTVNGTNAGTASLLNNAMYPYYRLSVLGTASDTTIIRAYFYMKQ